MQIYKSLLRAEALKRRFFDFKHKNETRRKEINASQLAIRNLNDTTGKHVNTPCFFYFYLVFFKTRNFSSTLCRKQTLFPVI